MCCSHFVGNLSAGGILQNREEGSEQSREEGLKRERGGYKRWTEEEEAALLEGVEKFGRRGKWSAIKQWKRDALINRTGVRSKRLPKCVLGGSCPWWVQPMV